MYAVAGADRARWAVKWIARGKVIGKDFGPDFSEALSLYLKAEAAGKKGVALVCKNMSFPPPLRLQPHEVTKIKRNDRGKRVRVQVEVTPMKNLNVRGAWWCPYCIKLRKFVKAKGFYVGKIYVAEDHYRCPVCGARHSDPAVRKWNPVAQRIAAAPARRRAPRSTTRRRRRR